MGADGALCVRPRQPLHPPHNVTALLLAAAQQVDERRGALAQVDGVVGLVFSRVRIGRTRLLLSSCLRSTQAGWRSPYFSEQYART